MSVGVAVVWRVIDPTSINFAHPSGTVLTVLEITSYLGLFLGIVAISVKRHSHAQDLGLRGFAPKLIPLVVVVAIVATAAAYGVAALVSVFLAHFLPHVVDTQQAQVTASIGNAYVLGFIALCVIAPFVEETIFRGWIYGSLRGRMAYVPAAIVAATIFGALHEQPAIMPALVVLGFVLCSLYEYTGSIIPGMFVHAAFNLLGFLVIIGVKVPLLG